MGLDGRLVCGNQKDSAHPESPCLGMFGMTPYDTNFLFDDQGNLRIELFSKQAQDVLWGIHT